MEKNNLPELSMITVEMEEHWDQVETFLFQWEEQHPEIWNMTTLERLKLQNKALEEAGLK